MADKIELTDENLERLAKALGKGNVDLKDMDKLKEQLKQYTGELRRGQPLLQKFGVDLDRTTGFLKDTTGGLDKLTAAIKQAAEAEKNAGNEAERLAAKETKEKLESQ